MNCPAGGSYASKYAELQAQLQRVNQQLNEDGSQIDDRQEFAALDEEAFHECELRTEDSVRPPEETAACPEIAAALSVPAELAANSTPSVISEEKASQPEAELVIVEEPPRRQVTLDDLRNYPFRKGRQKPSTAPRADHSTQLSLWQ